MAWLVCDGRVLCSLEVADGFAGRAKGLLFRDDFEGALLIKPTRSVHTFGMRMPIDVVVCDPSLVVVRTMTLVPRRVTRPRLRSGAYIEAEAGSVERWGLAVGDQLECRT